MKLHVLFGQREESYEGEYAPEALLCWDEFCVDDNPDGFDEECARYLQDHEGEFVASKVILIDIDGEKVRDLLIGVPVLKGAVKA